MAISAATTWEVRSATGSDANGGAFVAGASGTDYSQQTSPQFSGTDLANVSSLVVASLSHSFVSGDVGNTINLSGGTGFTAGFYQIVSVAAGQATLDRSPGTVGVGGTWAEGGALATLTAAVAQAVPSNVIYCKGSETKTAALAIGQNGTATPGPPFSIIGYSTTRGDTGRFTLQTATNSIDLIDFSGGANQILIQNLLIKSTAGTPGNGVNGSTSTGKATNVVFNACRFTGFSTGLLGVYAPPEYFLFPELYINNCEVDHCGTGIYVAGVTFVLNCYIHDNTVGVGTQNNGQISQSLTCTGTAFYNNSSYGAQLLGSYPTLFLNCVFSNNGVGAGYTVAGYDSVSFLNCIFYGNTTGVLSSGAANGLALNNAFGSNTTATSGQLPAFVGSVTLTADPFTNRTGGDFSLNSTAGGGAALKAAGYQSTLIG
jgi:hypothetical protein